MGTTVRFFVAGSLLGCALLLAACGSSAPPAGRAATAHTTTTGRHSSPTSTSNPAAGGPAPAVPTGAYLGAWVNPTKAPIGGTPGSQELDQLAPFQQQVGRHLAILSVYTPFEKPAPVATLKAIEANGSIPLISWGCAPPKQVAEGAYDSVITAYADALRAFGHPVFLRWFWEMNLTNAHPNCRSPNGPADFVAAWQHIHALFVAAGASNVSFVWNPGLAAGLAGLAAYYPGNASVDWIAIDGYQHQLSTQATFATRFAGWYGQWSGHGKPLMVGETGALPGAQATYLDSIGTTLPTQFPGVKALVYFDAPGPRGQWALTGAGITAFATLAGDSYFSAG